MLYEGNNALLYIESVEHLSSVAGTFHVAPRPYSSLTFRIKGTASVCVGDQTYSVNTNDIMYLPQNLEYTATYTETEMIAFHFVTARDDKEAEVYSFENGENIYKAFLLASELWEKKKSGFNIYAMSALYSVLGMICEKETRTQLPPHFLRAVSIMNSSYRNSRINVEDICTHAGISSTTFRQLFKKHYHKTPIEYIIDLRIEHARSLISSGMPVEAAAYESGFNDPKYFARTVKKRFGCTPRTFKTYGK